MRKIAIFFGLIFCLNPLFADEGMWLLTMLQKLQLQQKGCKLTTEQIYSINHSSVKDAIVGLGEADNPFNFFCTSELVSSKGLVFTNYHCGFDMIQKHTNLTNNYIDNGFWAKNQSEELPNEGITATIVYRIIDVSDKILPLYALKFKDPSKLQDTIASISAMLAKSVSDTSSYFGDVQGFFENNQYFLFVYEKFEDVRLVGAPPRSIGKFGGDTDNWMWPRHTGDFCVLRIYGNSKSKPARFSVDNTPITPRHYLPVSVKGYEKGDYAMVMGFPGSTDRYMTAAGIDGLLKYNNASVIAIGDEMLATYKKYMNADKAIKIKYAAKYDQMSNYWKYAIGQNQGIVALNVIQRKLDQEKEFTKWINADKARKKRYSKVLKTIEKHYAATNEAKGYSNYMNMGLLNSPELITFTYKMYEYLEQYAAASGDELQKLKNDKKAEARKFFQSYDLQVDMAQFIAMSNLYKSKVSKDYLPGYFKDIEKQFNNNITLFTNTVYPKSIFTDSTKTFDFIEKGDKNILVGDPAFYLLRNIFTSYFKLDEAKKSADFENATHLYLEATLKQNPDSLYYPDANSTLRLTYGYVGDYITPKGVHYNHYTTLDELVKKEDLNNLDEFEVLPKLKELHANKDYGMYANNKGELPVCFTTNNDITGGNSGSPVMNDKGELIGIAFDGNWEAMSGDIIFEPKVQKCISVDIRYVLFVIDKVAGAGYLVNELNLVK